MQDLTSQKAKLPTLNTGRCTVRLAQIEDIEALLSTSGATGLIWPMVAPLGQATI